MRRNKAHHPNKPGYAAPWSDKEDALLREMVAKGRAASVPLDRIMRAFQEAVSTKAKVDADYHQRTLYAINHRFYRVHQGASMNKVHKTPAPKTRRPVPLNERIRARPIPSDALDLIVKLADTNIEVNGEPNYPQIQQYLMMHAKLNNLDWDAWSVKAIGNQYRTIKNPPPEPVVDLPIDNVAKVTEDYTAIERALAAQTEKLTEVVQLLTKLVGIARISSDALEELATKPQTSIIRRVNPNANGKYGGVATGPDAPPKGTAQ